MGVWVHPTTVAEAFRARVEGALGFSGAAATSMVAASLAASFAAAVAFLLPFASLAGAAALSAVPLSLALLARHSGVSLAAACSFLDRCRLNSPAGPGRNSCFLACMP